MKKIGLFIVLAFIVRIFTLNFNLFWASEQGRDLLVVSDLVNQQKLTLIGPRTSIEGIFHGVLYYYSMVVPFFLGRGDPMIIMVFFLFWQCLGLVFLYLFINEAVNGKSALIASLLYATSYGIIVYSRWFSHPPLIIPFAILLFWSLYRMVKHHHIRDYLFTIGSWWAIFHLDLVTAIFFLPGILIFCFWQKITFTKLTLFFSLIVSLVFFLPYLLFDFRHDFLMFHNLQKFIFSTTPHANINIFDSLNHLVFRYTSEVVDILGPNLSIPVLVIYLLSFLWLLTKNNKNVFEILVLIWVLSLPTLGIFFNPSFGLKHYLVGLGPGFIVMVTFWLTHFQNRKIIIITSFTVAVILINNLFLIFNWLPVNRNVFYLFTHPQMVLGNEKAVLDYAYRDSRGQNFGWEAFTIPYFSPSGWQYMFNWYGKNKYGFIPRELKKGEKFYVIIEPAKDELFLNNWLKDSMDKRGKMIEEKYFDTIRVQKRDTVY